MVIQVPFVVKPWQEICNACIRRYTPRGPCWMGNSNHVDKILIEWGAALSDGGANYHLESARPNTVSEIVILNKATKKNPRLAHWSRITRGGYGAGGEPGAAFFLQGIQRHSRSQPGIYNEISFPSFGDEIRV